MKISVNVHFSKKYLKIIFLLVFFNSTLFSQEKKEHKKIDIKDLIFKYKKPLLIGLGVIGFAALMKYFLSNNKSTKTDKHKNENTVETHDVKIKNLGSGSENKNTNSKENEINSEILLKKINLYLEEQSYDSLRKLLADPSALAALTKNTKEQNRDIFEELYLNPAEEQFNKEDLCALLNLVKINVKITTEEFKKLNSGLGKLKIDQNSFLSEYKLDKYILFYNYAKHYGYKALYYLLVGIKEIKEINIDEEVSDSEISKKLFEELLDDLNDKDLDLYKLLPKKQEKIEKEDPIFIFKLLKENRVKDLIDYLKNLKERGIDPLDIIEPQTKETILHYIVTDDAFFGHEILDLIFSFNPSNNKIIWHQNIARLDQRHRSFLDCVDDISCKNFIKLLFSFDPQDNVLIKNLLERKNNEEEKTYECLIGSFKFAIDDKDNQDCIEILYFLLSYGVSVDKDDNYFKKTQYPYIKPHLIYFNKYYGKLSVENRTIAVNCFKKHLEKRKGLILAESSQVEDFTKIILECPDKEVVKEFLKIIFEPWLNLLKQADAPTSRIQSINTTIEKIKNILLFCTKSNLKNSPLLFDLFNNYLGSNNYQKFRQDLFELAVKHKNNEMIRTLLFKESVDIDSIRGRENELYQAIKDTKVETAFTIQFYLDIAEYILQNFGPSDLAYNNVINHLQDLIKIACEKKLPLLFPSLLTFSKKLCQVEKADKDGFRYIDTKILKQISPDFDISQLFEYTIPYDKWYKAIIKLLEDEFVLYMQNREESLFSFKKDTEDNNVKKYVKNYSPCDSARDKGHKNILHHAILKNDTKTINLLKTRTNINLFLFHQDELGNTPLHYVKDFDVVLELCYASCQRPWTNVFPIKNHAGKTPFECLFDTLNLDDLSKIFATDIFAKFDNKKYQGRLWHALFEAAWTLKNSQLNQRLHQYCRKYLQYIDNQGIAYILASIDEHWYSLLQETKKRNILLPEEKLKIIKFCINNKDQNCLDRILKFSDFYIDGCIGAKINYGFDSYFDLILESLRTGFHTTTLFKHFQKNIQDTWQNDNDKITFSGTDVEKIIKKDATINFLQKLIAKDARDIIRLIFEQPQVFELSEGIVIELIQNAIKLKKFKIADSILQKRPTYRVTAIAITIDSPKENREEFVFNQLDNILKTDNREDKDKEIAAIRNQQDLCNQNFIHRYKLPNTRDHRVLRLLINNFSVPLLDTQKDITPPLLQLCLNGYKYWIDDFFHQKLENKVSFTEFQPTGWEKMNAREFFIISCICRLKKTVTWLLNNNQVEVNKNKKDILNSDDKLATLYYYTNFFLCKRKFEISDERCEDKIVDNLYDSIEGYYVKDKDNCITVLEQQKITGKYWGNITPNKGALCWKDSEKNMKALSRFC